MGTKHGTGLPNRLCGTPTPEVASNSSTLYLGAGHFNTGDIQTYSKAGHQDHRAPLQERLLLQHLPGPQERWGSETGDQPQGSQQLHSHRKFQDGGNPYSERHAGIRGLANKVNLKDAYFAIPIHQLHQRFLQFQFQGKTYHFTCLPFGLSSALWVFTKTLKPVLSMIRQRGVWVIAYIYDILIIAESWNQAIEYTQALVYLLECLGFIITIESLYLYPRSQSFWVSLSTPSIWNYDYVPPAKMKQIQAESQQIMRMMESTSARTLARLLGKMTSTAWVIPPAPLFYRNLQMALSDTLESHSQDYEGQ